MMRVMKRECQNSSILYKFPESAAYGRVLPKSKIYENASPGSKVKEFFVREVEKIIWSYKLSPETINLPAKGSVREIQVITIILKTGTLKLEVLHAIDKAVASQIIFVLSYKSKLRYVLTYKRPSESNKNKSVQSDYFETSWMPENAECVDLPVVLDMQSLYQSLLKNIISLPSLKNETIDELVNQMDKLKSKEREAARLEARLKNEKQFNRKVEINTELQNITKEITALKR